VQPGGAARGRALADALPLPRSGQAIGEAIAQWAGPRPPWVSTAGMGVPWLHARLDTRPKYFRHAPYRAP